MTTPEPPTHHFHANHTLSAHSKPPNAAVPLQLAYRTYGSPGNSARKTVLLPTCYGGKLATTLPFLYTAPTADEAAPVFDPNEYFIIVVGLLGGGESSSPSNTSAPWHGANFPQTTYDDNIRLQHALCVSLGVERLYAYCGFSMGGQQAYHMATRFPDFVEHMVCIAGSAKTSWHNWSFLEGPKAALVNSGDFYGGEYKTAAVKGTRAFARVYVTWARSQAWFREKCWEECGCATLEEYIQRDWEGGLGAWDANDLLCLLHTWQPGDVGLYHPEDGGDLGKTLQRIRARCLVMPARTDMYFPPEDSEEEVKHLEKGRLRVIQTIWGHMAGGGGGTTVSF